MLKERVEIKHKLATGMMLALILVGVLNLPLTVTEVGVGNPESQFLKGDDLEPFSVAEDPWNFCNRIEWSRFAYFNDSSAEVVIGLRNTQPRSHDKLSSLVCEGCGEIVNTVSMGGEVRAVVADIPLTSVSSFVTEIRAAGLSRYIEPNIKFQANFVPNDPYWPQQWGPRIIEADYAWNTTIGDPSVLVAVIDTGIDYNHPDLAVNYVALGYDWVNNDTDPMDDYGHGTHCAGIIAASLDNGLGIAGVAQVQIMAEKGLDSGGSGKASDLANAIIHAVDQGADILSNSWGGYSYSSLIHDAVKYAQDHGVLVVASAGNEASSMKHYPAAYDEVVAVTATDQTDDPASFTSYGIWVDVGAPGVDVYSTVLNERYENHSGTSMACPHAAGVAALIWSEFPSLTADEVRLRLQLTADDLGDAGFDVYYGYGRVNARRAVEPLSSHDLLILNWKRPAYVEPGSSAIINTTVVNFGSSNEAEITVQLRANGSTVDSSYISYLASMKSVTVSCTWSPTVEGRYYVESYVIPVSGETAVENNVISAYINVRVGKFIRVPEDCSKIQEAVDLAGPGETIKVASGTYYESVSIDTSLKLVGDGRNTTVIDGNGTGTVVGVIADNVEVRGFTVQNSTGGLPLGGGVVLLGVKNCVVTNNTVTNNFEGVTLWGCTGNNSVNGNIAFSNEDGAIGSGYSAGRDTISDNVIAGGRFGVVIVLEPWDPSGYNRENTVSRNIITNSENGISILADDNTIVNNTITLCSDRGIGLSPCSGNTIRDNRIENNQRGIVLEIGTSSSRIYHNDFVHNTIQTSLETFSQNTWDDGYPSGGNHWSDYKGVDLYSGPYQNLTGSDGIADTPYIINDVNKDRYPLIDPLLTPFYGPTAKFTYSPEKPSVNIAMTFNASVSVSGWNGTRHVSFANYTWDFGDENITTVAGQVICHTYVAEGTYTVNLTVTCQDDPVLIAEGLMSDSTWQNITVVPPNGPTANFDYWTHIPYVNETVTFYASASLPGWNGTQYVPIANYTWDFDDGNITTTAISTIKHAYAYNRTYTVNLNVTCQDDPVLIAEGLTSDSTWKNITIRIEGPPLPPLRAVFEDDFESYSVGTFPYAGGWELWFSYPYANAEMIVDNTPTKALQLCGSYPSPSSMAAKRINTDSKVIGFEVWVRINNVIPYTGVDHTQIGFLKKTSSTEIEWYVKVSFTEACQIRANGQLLQSYGAGRWYKIRVVVDRPTGTFSVWIDDVLKGENLTVSGDSYEIQALALSQCLRGSLYKTHFDEVKIFEGTSSPTAEFDFWPTTLYGGDTVIFNASASVSGWNGTAHVPIANYTWNFGDGNVTTVTEPVICHTYSADRTYTVNLNVTCQDDPVLIAEGLTSDSTWKNITIEYPVPSHGPTAEFDFWPTTLYVGDTVIFNASASVSGWNGTAHVPIANYTWNFGDGNTTTTTNPAVTHVYVVAGTYTVNLTVACNDPNLIEKGLALQSKWQSIAIKNPSIPPPSPTVEIEFSPTIPHVNDTISFSSHVEYDPSLGWTSSYNHEIVAEGSRKYSGDYSGRIRTLWVGGHSWKPFTTSVSSGNITVVFWAQISGIMGHYFGVSDGPGSIGYRVGFHFIDYETGYIVWICNGTFHLIQPYSVNTWYKFELRIDLDRRKYSIRINDELKVAEAYANGAPSKVDHFDVSSASTGYIRVCAWIDNITVRTISGTILFAEDFEYGYVPIVSYEWNFGDGSPPVTEADFHIVKLVSPTGYIDPDGGWSYETNAYDDNEDTYAQTGILSGDSWSNFLYLTHSPITCNAIRVLNKYSPTVHYYDIDVYRDGSWVDVYVGLIESAWKIIPFAEGTVTQMRVRVRTSYRYGNYRARLYEADFCFTTTTNHTYTTFGTYNVTLTVTNRRGVTGTKWRTVTVTILGDINGDGVVDSADRDILGMAWGSTIGEPNYILEADLNDDGVVDSTDLGILGVNWGHSWL